MIIPAYRMKANHAGNCCICAAPIYTGDFIYVGTSKENPVGAHDKCAQEHPEAFDNLQFTGQQK